MNFWKLLMQRMRGYKHQAIILFLFGLMFSFLFLGCMVTYSAFGYAKENVGKYMEASIRIKSCEDDSLMKYSAEGQKIPVEWIRELSGREEIKAYEMASMAGVHGIDVKHFDYFYDDDLKQEEDEKGSLLLVYQKNMKNHKLFKDQGNTLLEGRWLEENESGFKAVIGKSTAEENEKSVGDTIQLTTLQGESLFLEIVGISSCEYDGTFVWPTRLASYNFIFTTKEVVDQANLSENVFEVEFELKDCKDVDRIKNEIQEKYADKNYIITTQLTEYHTILAAFTNNQTTVAVLFITVLFMSAVITGLFAVYSLSERFKEVGILISLGMRRREILLQYILELLLPAACGNLICLGLFYLLRTPITSFMIHKIEIIPELTISVSGVQILAYFSCVLFMMLISLIYICYKVIKNNPKELMVESNG